VQLVAAGDLLPIFQPYNFMARITAIKRLGNFEAGIDFIMVLKLRFSVFTG